MALAFARPPFEHSFGECRDGLQHSFVRGIQIKHEGLIIAKRGDVYADGGNLSEVQALRKDPQGFRRPLIPRPPPS